MTLRRRLALGLLGAGLLLSSGPGLRVMAASTYATTVLADSPITYYRLGDASGTTATDSAATPHNGFYTGTPTLGVAGAIAGDTDTAVTLNGSTQWVTGTYNVTPPTTAVSYEAWFRTTTSQGGALFSFENSQFGTSSSMDKTVFMLNTGHVVFGIGTTTRVTVTTPLAYNDGRWHQVVAAYGSTDGLRLYMDGAQVATNLGAHAMGNYAGYLRVGYGTLTPWPAKPTSSYFAGTLDEAAMFSSELSAARVSAHYAANPLHPSAPQSPAAAAPGDNEAVVSWTAPATPGPLTITGYAVSASIGAVLADTVTAAAAATSVTLTGLDSATSYTFTVYALNANGPGPGASTAALTVTGTLQSYRKTVLADSPYLYLRLDDVTGSTAQDSSTAADTGTYQGGASRLQAGALTTDNDVTAQFDGSSGFVTTAISEPATNVFTVEAWFSTTTATGGRIAGWSASQYGASATDDRHVYMTTAGNIAFGVYSGSDSVITSPSAYNDGRPHLVDATLSAAGMKLYVDGVLVASNAAVTTARNAAGYWRTGYDTLSGWPSAPTSSFFAGSIDELAAYPSALSAARVLAHYQGADNVALSMSGLTPSFTLTGNASTTVSSNGAVTLSVTTNDPKGYTVTVQASGPVLTGAAVGNTDTIPIANLSARQTGAGTWNALSNTVALLVRSQAAMSAGGGDTVSTDYQVVIPFVNNDTYSVTVTYVVTAQ